MQLFPFFSPKDPSKPYDFCVEICQFFNAQKCDGPNYLRAGFDRFVELCILRKEILRKRDPKWTNLYIAEKAEVSITTINRFFSGAMTDIKFTTASQIVNALADGAEATHPCPMESLTKIIKENGLEELLNDFETKKDECVHLIKELAETKTEFQTQIDFLKQQIQAKDDQIVEKNKHLSERAAYMVRKDGYIKLLAILLCLCLLTVAVLAILLLKK